MLEMNILKIKLNHAIKKKKLLICDRFVDSTYSLSSSMEKKLKKDLLIIFIKKYITR